MSTTPRIIIERCPTTERLESFSIDGWGTWECEPSTFDWYYEDDEVCYVHEGEVEVETERETVTILANDLVYFPKGLSCVWRVKSAIRKVFTFGITL